LVEQGNILVLHNRHHSSCISVTAIENDDNRYPIDDLEKSKECSLVTPILGISRTVAYGLARPFVEETLFNSHPIPKGYAIVHMDIVKPGHRRSKLEYHRENDECILEKNVGCHVLWCKRDIEFGEEDFESSSVVATTTTATYVVATATAATCVAATTTTVSSTTATTTAVSSITATMTVSSATAQEDNFIAQEENFITI
jgi:hypothetical protein